VAGDADKSNDEDARVRHEGQLRVPVAELRRNLGSRLDVRRSVVLADVAVVDASIPEDGIIEVDLVLDAISDGLVASGSVAVPWVGTCRRCLSPVTGRSSHRVQEAFTLDGDGDTYVFAGDEVDLEPLVRDAAALGLPLAPLCGDDCRGPDPERFPARPAVDGPPPADPRWAALDGLTFDDDR
jgi:uncharacterized protein